MLEQFALHLSVDGGLRFRLEHATASGSGCFAATNLGLLLLTLDA